MFIKSLLFTTTFSHLVFNTPETWGISDSIALEQPMDIFTSNFVCAGKSPEQSQGVITLVAGQSYDFQTICGERDLNAAGCSVYDWHAGENASDNSGCVLGVAYNDYNDLTNHKFMTYESTCPLRGNPVKFNIPIDTPPCEKCVCSWGWAPSRQYSSPAQFYHNCFYCNIISSSSKTPNDMKKYEFINSAVSQYKDITYNLFFSSIETTTETTTEIEHCKETETAFLENKNLKKNSKKNRKNKIKQRHH